MPNLNVITWNSTGETIQGADTLLRVINWLTANGWQPHVIVVQEADSAPGGAIYQMLAGLGGAYNGPPAHANENSPNGRGYLLATHNTVAVVNFRCSVLGADPVLRQWIGTNLSQRAQNIAVDELAEMRNPATARLLFDGRNVPFLTWHVPRGPGQVLVGATLQGGANPDAFLFLQNSGIYQSLTIPGADNIGIIAGDLNVTYDQINTDTRFPDLRYVLPGWSGVSHDLDHVLGHPQAGQAGPAFADPGNFPASGTHQIVVSTVAW